MSSVTSAGLAQIPRNSYFRAMPYALADRGSMSTSVLTFIPTSGVAPVLTNNAGGVTGSFISTPWMATTLIGGGTAFQALSSGAASLKDLGDTIVSAGRTFRRVQLLNFSTATTEMNGGTYGATTDSDALVGYIEVGFRGIGSAGPFVRGY